MLLPIVVVPVYNPNVPTVPALTVPEPPPPPDPFEAAVILPAASTVIFAFV